MPKLNKLLIVSIISGLVLPSTVFAANSDSGVAEKVVVYSKNGKLYKYELYIGDSKTPALVNNTSSAIIPLDAEKTTYNSLQAFEDSQHASVRKMQVAAGGNTKIALGYVPSIQALYEGVGDACYNSQPKVEKRTIKMQSKLVMTSTDAQNTSMMSNDTNVSLKFDGFHSKVSNTYSQNYAGSIATGDYNLAAALATVVNTGIPANNELNENGKAMLAKDPVEFFNRCGTSAVAAYVGGILTTINIKVVTGSHSAQTDFSNSVSAGYGPVDVSNAFKSGKSNAENITAVRITVSNEGSVKFRQPKNGAADYATYISNAMRDKTNADNLVKCEAKTPDLTACANYMSAMSSVITDGLLDAEGALSNPPAGEDADSFGADTLHVFPNGINMASNDPKNTAIKYTNPSIGGNSSGNSAQLTYSTIPGVRDPFADNNVIEPLKNSVKLIYQLNALSARAALLASLPNMTTTAERNFLNNLSTYYAQDSIGVYTTAYDCYASVFKNDTGNTQACKKMLNVSAGELNYQFSNLPNNAYQLYNNNSSVPSSSLQEVLFKNTMALQYEVDYTDKATAVAGKSKYCEPCFIRSGNQIGFGLAYYNRSLYNEEFFGGAGSTQPNQIAGYIFPNTVIPSLGNTPNEYINNGINGMREGVRFWTMHKSENAIMKLKSYTAAPLYFVYNSPQLLEYTDDAYNIKSINPYACPGYSDTPKGVVSCSLFNKVIGNNMLSADSSAKKFVAVPEYGDPYDKNKITGWHNENKKLYLYRDGAYAAPSLSDYINGKNIPTVSYTFKGEVTTKNTQNKKAEECFAGVYLPSMDYPGNGKEAVLVKNSYYGSTRATKYLCNGNPDYINGNTIWSSFELVTGKDPSLVKSIEQGGSFSFNHIRNFFGLSAN